MTGIRSYHLVDAALRWVAYPRMCDEESFSDQSIALALAHHTLSRGHWPAGNNIVREHYM